VRDALIAAGWAPGRSAPVAPLPADFSIFPAAETVLREFSGLHIGSVGPGQQCATSDLLVDPAAGSGLSEHIGLSAPNGSQHFPIGEYHNGHGYLLIGADGAVDQFFDELEFYAPSFDQALSQLVLGLRPQSM
jgi:hypothetical protein